MPLSLSNKKSILIQVMAWCRQQAIIWAMSEWVSERLSLTVFLGTGGIGCPISPYKLSNHNLYTILLVQEITLWR